ncbi:MAG: gspD 1 [Chthoniobacter sp.]|nr:gspD 1 [Chthoniobacter sp.]
METPAAGAVDVANTFMNSSFPGSLLRCVSLITIVALHTATLQAQTIRPGGSARTGARAGGTTSRSGVGTLGGASTGPRQYRSNTLLGDATIQIDPETRSLIVVTDEETHTQLQKVILDLDRPKPQVLIKVVFVEVTYNKGYDVGLEASYIFDQSSAVAAAPAGTSTTNTVVAESGTNALGGTTTTTTTTNNAITNAATTAIAAGATKLLSAGSNFGLSALTEGSFVRLLTDDWSATLRLLATRGKVEVLSRPSIMARNNQEAVIVVGQEVPFVTSSRTDALGQLTNTIQYDNIGIILRVTPFITSEGTVEMIVAPEISSLSSQTVPISNTASAPVITKRSAETVVVTPNGATMVIGGLMETQRIESVRKIPILGDIPILGIPFRRTVKDETKRELLIFLTPQIVNSPAAAQRVTNDEMARADLVNKAFTGEDFDKYLGPQSVLPEPLPELPLGEKEVRREVRTETTQTISTPPRAVAVPVQPAVSTARPVANPVRPAGSSTAPKAPSSSRQRPPK